VALFDIVKLYGSRVVEIHARQSEKGVWTEVFGPGDIDYLALTAALNKQGVKPHLVLEQAVEAKTPKTLTASEAHRRGVKHAAEVFAAFAG
jgi:inosose dehydratase